MNSIRRYLVLVLLAAITLTVFLAALHGYRASMAQIEAFMDSALSERAHLLAMSATHTIGSYSPVEMDERNAFQVYRDNRIVWRSANAPREPLTTSAGFTERNFGGHRWRTFTWENKASSVRATVAERIDLRNSLAEHVIMESVLPVVVVLPIAALLIWIVVGRGLSPLRRLAAQLRGKQPDDLSPIPAGEQPSELRQLVDSTNALLRRLQASFERERRFSADAAHELRTPIAALKVHLHNFRAETGNPDLQHLEEAVDRMNHVVDQMLALYRTSPEHYVARFGRLDLHELARETLSAMYPVFDKYGIDPELHGDSANLFGDRPSLEILLKNLLDNACKHTPPGGRVRVTVAKQADASVQLRVEDSGPGVPEDQYERIFDRFYRYGGNPASPDVIGCGLGLPIVMHIAELHQASVVPGRSRYESGFAITVQFPHRREQRRLAAA